MTWLTRLMERTEYVKELRESAAYWEGIAENAGLKLAELERRSEPDTLPYCVKCGQGRKRGEKFTELTFKHDHCPSDDACEVVSAKMPQEVEG